MFACPAHSCVSVDLCGIRLSTKVLAHSEERLYWLLLMQWRLQAGLSTVGVKGREETFCPGKGVDVTIDK